jgi:hypothetical protein
MSWPWSAGSSNAATGGGPAPAGGAGGGWGAGWVAALALRLADGLRPRVAGAPVDGPPEAFLETLLATKAARGGQLARPAEPS